MQDSATLKRSLGLPMVTFYGLGTIVGGGFYALVGKVASEAGMLTPLAFLAAALIALFSAFSYAELSARYPYSAGEAHYALVAFRRAWPSGIVGWAVIATGVVSAATLSSRLLGLCAQPDRCAGLDRHCHHGDGPGASRRLGDRPIRHVGPDHYVARTGRARHDRRCCRRQLGDSTRAVARTDAAVFRRSLDRDLAGARIWPSIPSLASKTWSISPKK